MMDLPGTSDYVSPGNPASIDHFLAADDLLLKTSSDLPMLPLPLLPLPGGSSLSSEPVVAHSPDDPLPSYVPVSSVPSVPASPDLSLEGPFDARKCASVSGAAPLVLDSLPGCQYRMTSYDSADASEVDPAFGLQLHHPRFLEYVGAPESACLLSRPRGTGSTTWKEMKPCRRPSSCNTTPV